MPYLLTTQEMYKADALAIASGVAGIELMEKAGHAVFREITKRWQPRPVGVLCGPGNNGGDGFVIARLMLEAGWPVRLGLLGDVTSLTGDAKEAASRWPGPVEPLGPELLEDAPLIVDAMFGAGLGRALSGVPLDLITEINRQHLDCVAVDVPSGVLGDTGQLHPDAPRCQLTVTFFKGKPGHFLEPAKSYLGELAIVEIGIPAEVTHDIQPQISLNNPDMWGPLFPSPEPTSNKFSRGHVVIVGGEEMTGAGRLAARAARRIGAGLVTVASPSSVWHVYAGDQPGTMVRKTDQLADFTKLIEDPRLTALVIGPGLGREDRTRSWVLKAIERRLPVVLDADSLSAFESNPKHLTGHLHDTCVLTPHEGEFARIFPFTGDRIQRVRAATDATGACVLLKGADTIIGDASGALSINATGTPYLATAGSGDVLAGMIGGLLAQGMPPQAAACAGAWIHGKAAEAFGPGLVAEDIPELIPEITRTIIKMSFEAS